jgi:tetratricopeptide (TPR) repeat protein
MNDKYSYDSYGRFFSKRTPRVFVSSSHEDKDFCVRLVKDLRTELGDESAVWYHSKEGFRSGNMWWDTIIEELNRSNIFIVVLSPDAMISPHIRHEMNRAFNRNMFILPVLYRECVIHPDLRRFPTISFLHHDCYRLAFNKLLHTLDFYLKDRQTIFTAGSHVSFDELLSNEDLHLEDRQTTFTTNTTQDLLRAIEYSFAQERWHQVLRKINYLNENTYILVPASVYRMRAIALYNIGYKYLALESLDTALALVSSDQWYLLFLKDYVTILASLHRWIDLTKIVQEALHAFSDNKTFLRIQKCLEQISQSDTELEHILASILETEKDISTFKSASKKNIAPTQKIFISYSHKDKEYLDRLHIHLEAYGEKDLEVLDDTKIEAGSLWEDWINKAINLAKVAVLLVSADFLASNFINENELPPLMEAASREKLKILIVILGTCDFLNHSLSKFQTINSPDKPLAKMSLNERDEIWLKLKGEIKKYLYSK